MNKVSNFFIGLFLTIIGSTLFLRNITFTGGEQGGIAGIFAQLFGESTKDPSKLSGILLVVIFVTLLIACIKPNIFTITIFILSLLVFLFAAIAGMKIQIADMTGIELTVVVGMIIVGLGLTINSYIALEQDQME